MTTPATSRSAPPPPVTTAARALPPLLLDALLVLAFAAAGRATHDEGHTVVGALGTAAPFLAGLGAGWLVLALARRRAPLTVPDGIPVWLATVVLGMALRAATGQGTAWSFVAVATGVLAAFLLGWRLLRALALARRPSS